MRKTLSSEKASFSEEEFNRNIENIIQSPKNIWIYKQNPKITEYSCNQNVCVGKILVGARSFQDVTDDVPIIHISQRKDEKEKSTMVIEIGDPGDPQY